MVSGLLWGGTPHAVLELGRTQKIHLYQTENLVVELDRILQMKKFEQRLAQAGERAHDLVIRYRKMSECVQCAMIPPTIFADPIDDEVLACAVSAEAEAICSGDHHLLDLGSFRGIPILKAGELLALIGTRLRRNER